MAGAESSGREAGPQAPAGFAVVRTRLPSRPGAAELAASRPTGRAAPAPAPAFRGRCRGGRKPGPVRVQASGYQRVPGNAC